jgi:hypothetical protein
LDYVLSNFLLLVFAFLSSFLFLPPPDHYFDHCLYLIVLALVHQNFSRFLLHPIHLFLHQNYSWKQAKQLSNNHIKLLLVTSSRYQNNYDGIKMLVPFFLSFSVSFSVILKVFEPTYAWFDVLIREVIPKNYSQIRILDIFVQKTHVYDFISLGSSEFILFYTVFIIFCQK